MISDYVKRLLAEIGSKSNPLTVCCTPEKGVELDGCFPLVAAKVAEHGGESVLGW